MKFSEEQELQETETPEPNAASLSPAAIQACLASLWWDTPARCSEPGSYGALSAQTGNVKPPGNCKGSMAQRDGLELLSLLPSQLKFCGSHF